MSVAGVEGCDRWRADLRTVVTMLEGMADEKPALWMQSNHVSWAGKQPFMARCAPTQLHPDFVPVYLRPTPQSQPTEAQIEAWQLLADLVAGLEATHWSSWQTTAHFDSALDAARAALAAKDE